MNSVHEPGSRTMSKNQLRNNTKSIRIENKPSAQPVASPRAQAVAPRAQAVTPHAQAIAPRAPAAPCCSPAPPARSSTPHACRLSALHRAPCLPPVLPMHALRAQPRAQLPSPCCIVTQAYPGSQYSLYCNTNLLPTKLYCNTVSSQASHLYCNTLQCIATQFQRSKLPSLQYNIVYCNTISLTLSLNLCNTTHSLAIQNIFSQYHLGSSPKTVLHNFFFFSL